MHSTSRRATGPPPGQASAHRVGIDVTHHAVPVEIARLEFISMDPPKHDRIKALFLSGFRAERIAAHEPWMEITGEAPMVESFFLDQHKTLPVRLGPRAS